MYNESRTVDYLLASYTAKVRDIATRELLRHGYLGIDPRPLNDGPKSLAELNSVYADCTTRYFPVNVEGNEQTVFTDPAVNLLFRAWHDICHIILGAPFTRGGEHAVAVLQGRELDGIYKDILMADVVDQYDYFATHGKYVKDQRSFVVGKVFGKLDEYLHRAHDAVTA